MSGERAKAAACIAAHAAAGLNLFGQNPTNWSPQATARYKEQPPVPGWPATLDDGTPIGWAPVGPLDDLSRARRLIELELQALGWTAP